MIRSRALFRSATALALLGVFAVSGCGGKKRPPAVLTDPSRTTAPPASPAPWPSPADAPVEGPDVQPVAENLTSSIYNPGSETVGGPLTDIHFGYDEATLTDEARATLEKHALWLQNNREVKVTIEGHCDERGTVDYNLALGDQRARAARDYLLNLGVAGERMNAISLGKERPLDPASTEEAWARNRRAHFVLVR